MSEQSTGEERRSIEQIGRMVRSIVEFETLDQFYWVGGKVNRYYKSDLGHIYLNLVNGQHTIRCMLPDQQASKLNFDIKNDMEIEVYDDVQVYAVQVQVQIIVQKAKLIDSNDLSVISAIDQLKNEGLYPKTPKSLPSNPKKIGIITSRSSRAVGDFENSYQMLGRTATLAPVIWQYVILEGDKAQVSILDGITKLNQNADVDLIAIIRGGGRYENLAVFDDLEIARTIATSQKYIITGIGHYKDSTLADYVSDYVASTPTAVAHYLANLIISSIDKPVENSAPSAQMMNVMVGAIGILFIIAVILLILNFT